MFKLRDTENGAVLGTITDEQFQFLIDHLEEESELDQDYYINRDTLDMFEEEDADPALVELLRKGLGDRDEMEIRWSKA
jgi:hypothetical protein